MCRNVLAKNGDKILNWVEVCIRTTDAAVEAISEILIRYGANGVAINDPCDIIIKDREMIIWDYLDESVISTDKSVYIKAYYPDDEKVSQTIENIKKSVKNVKEFLDVGNCSIELNNVSDRDWENEWKKYYKPLLIGQRILIKPSWEKVEVKKDEIVVELDPGMAFGTGTHESTRMCIELLEKNLKHGDSLLDIGCGSGILSIVGAKLGCSKVLGIDIDSVAVKTSNENIEINNVQGIVSLKKATLEDIEVEPFDVVVANLVADIIINISERSMKFLNENGIFITSGIIRDRVDEVRNKLNLTGFKIIDEINMGEWVAIAAKKAL